MTRADAADLRVFVSDLSLSGARKSGQKLFFSCSVSSGRPINTLICSVLPVIPGR